MRKPSIIKDHRVCEVVGIIDPNTGVIKGLPRPEPKR